ncbi:LINE-1 type transposase domain-containing protein 1 [Anabarilius grahami]|uniref:LINE-1 type transposase domain-containing protein 1 n=1 Tax=Anabarilius grahami TaxID=495550 RepID=A0A3N0XNX4_ANAGA|nr:LINE-1 type transposase domain-containing protein 1 [Anabarilius grahami]
MSKTLKSSACGDIKRHLRSHTPDATQDQDGRELTLADPETESTDGSQDIANIYTILTKISSDMEGIAEIRKTTASVEAKLSALITRLDEVEKRVEFLEGAERELQANPPATKAELEQIWDTTFLNLFKGKLCWENNHIMVFPDFARATQQKRDRFKECKKLLHSKKLPMENWNRRNNVRIVGIPEGKEGQDMVRFLDGLIPQLIDSSGRQLEIERAHRSPGQRLNSTDRPRPILAKFLRSADRDFVLRAARIKGKLCWENNHIMVFPDFARAIQQKRDRFKECKKLLHSKKVSFTLLYPAKLRIETKDGRKTFSCPRQAMAFIEKM